MAKKKLTKNVKTTKEAAAAKSFVRKHLNGVTATSIVRGPSTANGRNGIANQDLWIDEETHKLLSDPAVAQALAGDLSSKKVTRKEKRSGGGRELTKRELKMASAFLFGPSEDYRTGRKEIESVMAETLGAKSVKVGI